MIPQSDIIECEGIIDDRVLGGPDDEEGNLQDCQDCD